MTLLQRWRDQLRNYADSHRDTAVFGPNHPAVRAAKRYCERTEAQWEIGAGGRCELGKRALKQWGYEIWANIRTRWLIISLPSLGILIWGLSIDVGQTLVVVATILGALYIVVGIFTGLLADEIVAVDAAFSHILRLRLAHQIAAGPEGGNGVPLASLNDVDRAILKESLKQARRLQQRLKLNYGL